MSNPRLIKRTHWRSSIRRITAPPGTARTCADRSAGSPRVRPRGGRAQAAQHLGDRRSRGLLEVRRGAAIYRWRPRFLSPERLQLVFASDRHGARDRGGVAGRCCAARSDARHAQKRRDAAVSARSRPNARWKEGQQLCAALRGRRARPLSRRTDSTIETPHASVGRNFKLRSTGCALAVN